MSNEIKTNNLISTPNITGNIGSCTTQKEQVLIKSSIFQDTGYNVLTNSCSGEVTKTDYVSINYGMVLFFGFLFICFLIAWANKDSYQLR